MIYDMLLHDAYIPAYGDRCDIGIYNGMIMTIQKTIRGKAKIELDIQGNLVSSPFVDSHMHIDKALLPFPQRSEALMDAVKESERYLTSIPLDKVEEDIAYRSKKILDMAVRNGTGVIKTNVLLHPVWRMRALDVMLDLKEEYKDRITLLCAVPYETCHDEQWRKYAALGQVDAIAGYPSITANPKAEVDRIFALAAAYGLPIDLHVDESDVADVECFRYILEKTIQMDMQGKVTCGHVTALAQCSQQQQEELCQMCKEAGVYITTLTSCNMYLMDMARRGPTCVKRFLQHGVKVAIASDNVRDPFRPFGNCKLVEEALLSAQVHKMHTDEHMHMLWKMITEYPAANCMISDYTIREGSVADLIVLSAKTIREAILSNADTIYNIRKGTLIVKNKELYL